MKLECSRRDERLDGEFAALETGFDVCREGCVSFSHPANQKNVARAIWNLLKCSIRQAEMRASGWDRGLLVSVCLCTYMLLLSDLLLQPLGSVRRQETREGEHARLWTHHPWLSRFLWQGRTYLSSGQLFYLLWGESKGNGGKWLCVPWEAWNYDNRCRWSHVRLPATIAFIPTDTGRRKWAKKVG